MMKSEKTSFSIPYFVRGFLLLAVTFAAYYPAWNGQPVWDDDAHITRPELRSGEGLARIWTQIGATQQYYPLVHTVFWVEHRLFGDSTFGYHLFNILLHVFSALFIVTILRKLGLPGAIAWLAGGIFALHPVMVESVAWISELKNVLSGFFFFGAASTYLTFDRGRQKKHYLIALLFFFSGLLSKSVLAVLPAVLLAVFWWKRGKLNWRRDVTPLLPFFIIGIISGLFTVWVERRYIGAEGSEFNIVFLDRCLITGRAVWFYLYKLLWPANLMFTYPRWNIHYSTAWQYLFPAAFLLTAVLFWRLRNRSRAPLAALLYYVIMLFPALGFFNVYPFRYSFVADHFQYLASIGPITAFAAIMVQGGSRLQERLRRLLQPFLYAIPLAILFLLSWKQSGMYLDAKTLYQRTIQKNPNSWMAHTNLGHLLADSGRINDGMLHLKKAVEIAPDRSEAHNNLGVLLERLGRTDEAMEHYRKAVVCEPNLAKPHNNLGALLGKRGKTDEAIDHLQRAVKLNPFFAEAHYNLGVQLNKIGRTNEAMAQFQQALQLNSNYAEAYNSLGLLLGNRGQTSEALAHYRKALELNPDFVEAHNNIGIVYAKMGLFDEAMTHFLRALELKPESADTHYNLCILLANMGRTEDARVHYLKALELNPDLDRNQ